MESHCVHTLNESSGLTPTSSVHINVDFSLQMAFPFSYQLRVSSCIFQHASFHKSHIHSPLLCSMAYCTLETCRWTKYHHLKNRR